MTAAGQLLPAIRTLADRYGLPDGLNYSDGWKLLCFCDEGGSPPYGVDPEESQLFPCWLAAALAHWEAKAEKRDGLIVVQMETTPRFNTFQLLADDTKWVGTKDFPYTPGDYLSRLTARTLALLDGARAVATEGEKPCHEPPQEETPWARPTTPP